MSILNWNRAAKREAALKLALEQASTYHDQRDAARADASIWRGSAQCWRKEFNDAVASNAALRAADTARIASLTEALAGVEDVAERLRDAANKRFETAVNVTIKLNAALDKLAKIASHGTPAMSHTVAKLVVLAGGTDSRREPIRKRAASLRAETALRGVV